MNFKEQLKGSWTFLVAVVIFILLFIFSTSEVIIPNAVVMGIGASAGYTVTVWILQ